MVYAEIARPANTTAYSSGQVVGSPTPGTLFTFPNVGRSASATGYIRSIRVLTNQSSCVAVMTVWLYNAKPTIIADGGVFVNLWAERNYCLGSVTMAALAQPAGSTGSDYALSQNFLSEYFQYSCTPATANLYAQLVTGTGFTPASGQIFRVELGVHQNEFQ